MGRVRPEADLGRTVSIAALGTSFLLPGAAMSSCGERATRTRSLLRKSAEQLLVDNPLSPALFLDVRAQPCHNATESQAAEITAQSLLATSRSASDHGVAFSLLLAALRPDKVASAFYQHSPLRSPTTAPIVALAHRLSGENAKALQLYKNAITARRVGEAASGYCSGFATATASGFPGLARRFASLASSIPLQHLQRAVSRHNATVATRANLPSLWPLCSVSLQVTRRSLALQPT